MKFFLKSLIGIGCISLAIFKFYPSLIGEPIDVDKFSDFYVSETVESEEENGGIELLSSNFYSVEREYKTTKEELEEEKIVGPVEKKDSEEFKTPQKEIYVVKSGDTLSGIAEKYNIDLEILQANNPKLSKTLKIDDEINIITENGIFYEVKKGDSLYRIASKYKVKIEELKKYNSEYANNLKPGQEIFIKDPDLSVVNRVILAKKTRPVQITTKTAKVSQSKSKNSVTSSLAKYSFNMPIKWTGVSSPFGNRFHPVLKRYIQHTGIDLKAKYIPLQAAKDGHVSFVGYMSGYGKIIIIKHNDGFETRSAHLNDIYVKKGTRVKAGDVIGKTGMSGRVTGPHLHFEIRKNNKPYDPMKYLAR